ncbi:MAG: hypothetical protein GY929_02315 [Actinomycetia bacterium]|nr:hypothetical protein [Actinomycetes bacterium]
MLSYLDANSGSMLASVLAGGAAGVAVAAKVGWGRVAGRFGRRDSDSDTADSVGPTDPESVDSYD